MSGATLQGRTVLLSGLDEDEAASLHPGVSLYPALPRAVTVAGWAVYSIRSGQCKQWIYATFWYRYDDDPIVKPLRLASS